MIYGKCIMFTTWWTPCGEHHTLSMAVMLAKDIHTIYYVCMYEQSTNHISSKKIGMSLCTACLPLLSAAWCCLHNYVRVSFSFLPKGGGKMGLYGLLGGQVYICVQSMWQTRGVRGMFPWEILILDLFLDAIWWNLGLFLHKHKLPFIVSLELL